DDKLTNFSWPLFILTVSPCCHAGTYKSNCRYPESPCSKCKSENQACSWVRRCKDISSAIPFAICNCTASIHLYQPFQSSIIFGIWIQVTFFLFDQARSDGVFMDRGVDAITHLSFLF